MYTFYVQVLGLAADGMVRRALRSRDTADETNKRSQAAHKENLKI